MSLIPSERDQGFNEALATIAAPAPRKRANFLPPESLFGLHHASAEIYRSFGGYGPFLVGSSIVRKDYRDVDVRLMIDDEDFDAMFPLNEHGERPRYMLMCLSISAWMRQVTGLPVDFQFQKFTAANAKRKGERQGLGHYAWLGDAT